MSIISTNLNADLIYKKLSLHNRNNTENRFNYFCATIVALNSSLINSSQNHHHHNQHNHHHKQHIDQNLLNEKNFLFNSCILNETNTNCLIKLSLNSINSHNLLLYYKIDIFDDRDACYDKRSFEHINDFSNNKHKYKYISQANYISLHDYNKKYSKKILLTPSYLPFHIHIPKSEHRIDNKLFISCEFLNDYATKQQLFFNINHFNLR